MSPAGQERGAVAEAARDAQFDDPVRIEHEEHPDSFDPGIETGYLRRGQRDHSLDPELGAAPFNPGPERFDSRRAKRLARRREKAERKRREREERRRREEAERERQRRERAERSARERRERQERERREHLERERQERLERERRERLEAERNERQRVGANERREGEQRAKAERERQAREQSLRRQRERRERQERERAERARAERVRLQEAQRRASEPKLKQAEQHRRATPRAEALARQRRARAAHRAAAANRSTAPALRPAGAPNTPGPSPTVSRQEPLSLRQPTVKVALALAAVTAIAFGAGALLGLPLPGLDEDADQTAASLGGGPALALDSGTPVGLTKGPYFPVVLDGPADFGEAAAKFHADRGGRKHEGQDVFAKPGTRLVAVRDGIVLDGNGGQNFYASGGGNTLVIYSQIDNRSYVYLHLLKPALVKAGEEVKAGQVVGQVGCTGSCDGPHLHFEIRNGRADFGAETKAVDPLPLMRQWPQRPVD